MKKIILIMFLAMASLPSFAQQVLGYSNTKWGMTPSEVVSAEQGRASIQNTPDVFNYGKGLVKIDSVEIGGDSYKVDFIFDNDQKLVLVNVVSPDGSPEFVNQRRFQQLESLLTQKYGSPKFAENHFKLVWNLGVTTVKLEHLYIGGASYLVAVSYYPTERVKRETKNL